MKEINLFHLTEDVITAAKNLRDNEGLEYKMFRAGANEHKTYLELVEALDKLTAFVDNLHSKKSKVQAKTWTDDEEEMLPYGKKYQ